MSAKLIISHFLLSTLSLVVLISCEEDPSWFPDMKCWSSYEENNFVSEGVERKGAQHYKELASRCNDNFEKDDPCLKLCVLQKWETGEAAEEEDEEIENLGFIRDVTQNIYRDTGFAESLAESIIEACEPYLINPHLFHHWKTIKEWTCSNNPQFMECVESYLNCSRRRSQYFEPLQYFNLSCHIKTPPVAAIMIPVSALKAEVQCKWHYAGNDLCIKGCIIHTDYDFNTQMRMIKQAGKKQDVFETAIDNIAEHLPGFGWHNDAASDVAKEIANRCGQFYDPDFQMREEMDECDEPKEYFEQYVTCVDNVWKCNP